MSNSIIRIAVTGGGGQIAYHLLFRIAKGDLFGKEQPIALHILEVEEVLPSLKGVVMELEDCAYPLLSEIKIGSNPKEIFEGVHYALLVGAKPRGPGMERKDLLVDNAKIFVEQGKALNAVGDSNVKVLVVGNPCNTNCLIAMNHAPRIPRTNFFAMTRLDQNRATNFLAKKAGVSVKEVKNVIIWGNHSTTQVPDFFHAEIYSKPILNVLSERDWLENEFISAVQKRGATVIAARGKSSAASAANAIVDTVNDLILPTPEGEWFSCALCSDNNPYGIEDNLIFSFPCRSDGKGNCEVVKDLTWNDFLEKKIKFSERELREERALVLGEGEERDG